MQLPENWNILNRYRGRHLALAGVLLAIAGVVGLFVDSTRTGLVTALYALAPLWAVIPPTLGALARGRRLERTPALSEHPTLRCASMRCAHPSSPSPPPPLPAWSTPASWASMRRRTSPDQAEAHAGRRERWA
jgi:hypothetical protein